VKTATAKEPQAQQAKAIESIRGDLNEIGYLVTSLMWLGDKLREDGNAVDEGVLLKHVSLAIAELVDSMTGRLPVSEEPEGGAA